VFESLRCRRRDRAATDPHLSRLAKTRSRASPYRCGGFRPEIDMRSIARFVAIACALVGPFVIAGNSIAQQAAKPAPAQKPAATAPEQPALSTLAAARAPELSSAGIRSVHARTGKQRRDIQVATEWGPVYFAWPKGVTPAPFELVVDKAAVKVVAPSYSDKDQALYAKAFDAVLPEAVRRANEMKAQAQRPKR
jgi:hypothetical protein